MSSSSTEDEAPGKRPLKSSEGEAAPAQWVVKRQRSGALVAATNELQRTERHTQAISPAPSAGCSGGKAVSPKPRRNQTSARPFTCQVEDCTRDVCELSTYHFRYRICNVHIRLPAFMRQGRLQRFCQQCGRCHELSEFEGNQRSCRAQLDRHNARRRQAKKNAQAAKSGAAGQSNGISAASQPLSSAHAAASASREQARAYSADLEQYQRSRAIRPVGKLGQAMPAAEAAALLAAAANGQPRFALGSATSAFGQYNEALVTGPSQHPGSRLPSMGGPMHSRQPALFKGGLQPQTSEESMSQQPQISSSSSEGAGQTAEASAALQSLYEIARSSQHDGASSRAPRLNYRRAEKDDKPERSQASYPEGHTDKAVLSPRMKEQAAVVAAELSARTPADGVAKIASFTRAEATEQGSPPVDVSAAHPKLRQKTADGNRAAATTSTWQHSEHSSSAPLAGLPALATVAAAAEGAPEGPSDQPEPSDQQQQGKGGVQAQRVDSNAQSDPIEPQPTPFEAFTQAPLSSEKPEAGAAKAKVQVPDIMSSMESSAMGMSMLSASHTHVDRNRSVSIRSGGTGSMQASRSMSDSFAHGRSLDSSAPTDSSVARNTVERNAQLLGFLQKNHLLETSQALAASVGSAALGAALAQRAASTQSSMDVMTAEHLAAALPELGHSLQESAGRGGSSLAPSSSMALSGKPPAFPQGQRPGRLASVTEEEEALPNKDAICHWLQYGRPPGTKGVFDPQKAPSKATSVAPVQKDKAVEGGLPERAQEHKTLAGSLPQGLRTALGLSMGQPVGHLKPTMEKGQLDVGLPAASPATVTVATAAVPGVSTGDASSKMDAMLGSRAQLSKPQQLESTAAIQQLLFAPVARSTGQVGMEPARASLLPPAFASVPSEASGAGLFRAAQMPMHMAAANPMAIHLYQALMAASMMGAGAQHPMQEGAPVHAMPSAMNPGMNANMLLGPPMAPDSGQAAMAQLLAMRSEVLTVHLSVKLFHCAPQDLPEDAQEQLTAWLRNAPACTELYIRSGCVHLTLTASIDEATYVAAAEGGVLAVAKSLVQQPSDVWRKGTMLLSFMDETVMVADGVHERVRSLAGLCSGVLAKAEPLLTMPGQLLALEVQKLPSAAEPCRVLCRSRGTYWAIQAEPLDSGDSSSLYGVRLPLDMPPGIAYLEVEQGPYVGQACPVVVMPHERFMATAEVLQLLRGDALAACSQLLGGAGAALASQIAAGACTQLGLLLKHSAARMASASVLAVPEGTPPALQAPPKALPPPAIAKLNANLLQFAMLWSMPNLAHMFLEGLQAHQPMQQPHCQAYQLSFSFPQTSIGSAWGSGWGFQNRTQARAPSPSPLALLAAAAQMAHCTA